MFGEKGILSRRDFIKAAGAAGLGSALGPVSSLTAAHASASTKVPEQLVVPTRPFGKTGVDVSISANFYASIGSETDDALKMTENFLKKGYTAEQAKLKVVWDNHHIASICSAMPNMTILQANIDAALNQQRLSAVTILNHTGRQRIWFF